MSPSPQVTQLLRAWSDGDAGALDKLTPLVYDELRRRAHRYMAREQPGNTLQATALVHEAYIRLIDIAGVRWQDRAHFFAIAAQMMRRILVDAARARGAEKRGGEALRISSEEGFVVSRENDRELVALNDALEALSKKDARKERVVELRFFGGLTVEETAEVLKVSADTVMRDWTFAKAWLAHELEGRDG